MRVITIKLPLIQTWELHAEYSCKCLSKCIQITHFRSIEFHVCSAGPGPWVNLQVFPALTLLESEPSA